MTTRIEVNVSTGESTIVNLTKEELDAANMAFSTWQMEETERLSAKAAEEYRKTKFEEWLATQNIK